ncbi:putative adenylyltransferase/sulfurtransferase MoeZ [Pseudoruegeria aquimaris]|uniref:Putative adenylyltransferase/sulfurtransferase MoeZ n=1 Tax=Pseudoruegeria aquimaris TaxID=393663 RepID=A0A1Y5SEY5_9RHOB|nr:HesA/MoeB/ThiF family protein [Pseudoruegeria aquimaris]SLN36155.1 putative adenylyltransferase/sulfurtransferase MoeZ [Pseudoruegeria aquimaris]
MSRYARQMILPEVGPEGQQRLSGAHALVVGAGGLGAAALPYLVGAGLGHITLVDPDRVDASNLHRQVLFTEADVGRSKARAATARLEALNGEVTVEPVFAALTPDNVDGLIHGCDVVLDCADTFAASYTLSDACVAAGIPLFTASVLGTEGYAAGCCGGAPSLRAIFPDLPAVAGSCATNGVLGPVVGTLGTLQAQMALNHLLGLGKPLGQMLRYDAVALRTATFRFDDAPEPADGQFPFISHRDIAAEDFVVELRGADEAPCVTPNARRMRPEDFIAPTVLPGEGQRAVMVCRTGLRSWRAGKALNEHWSGEIALVAMGDTAT